MWAKNSTARKMPGSTGDAKHGLAAHANSFATCQLLMSCCW
jgi:hypothetical protein